MSINAVGLQICISPHIQIELAILSVSDRTSQICFDWIGLDCWPALLLHKRVIKLPKGSVSWTNNEIDLQVFERV